jgi:ubiquinone/menaquinone biosynthesis C-methylase UbiE
MDNEKEDVLKHFEGQAISRRWESLYSGKTGTSYNFIVRRQTVLSMISQLEFSSVIDLGCGTGDYASYFLDRDIEYIGVDNSGEMIKRASCLYPGVSFEVGDVEELHYPSRRFDLALAVGLIEYFPNPDRLIKETHRILKIGGYLVVQAPHPSLALKANRIAGVIINPFLRILMHQRGEAVIHHLLYTKSTLVDLIEPHGFKHCTSSYCNYQFIAWPLSQFFDKTQVPISKRITRLDRPERFKFLACNIISVFRKI